MSQPDNGTLVRDLVRKYVPEIFHPAASDWLSAMSDQDRQNFLESLSYSRDNLYIYAEQAHRLRKNHRTRPLILHVDDDPGTRTFISIVLTRGFGKQVVIISIEGSAGGLILASTLLPDLIVTDIMEPGMSGFDFAKYLRKNPVTRHVPFVFLTAMARPDSVRMGLELGAQDYLSKPILYRDLIADIEKALKIKSQNS